MLTFHQIQNEIYAQKAAARQKRLTDGMGILRGGNTGLYQPGEKPALSCPRKTILRTWFGVEPPTSTAEDLIFANGLSSEAQMVSEWTDLFKSKGLTLISQDNRTEWLTSKGTPVQGSPDIVVLRGDTKKSNAKEYVFMCELKNMNSVYKALGVLADSVGCDAIAQGAHYSYNLGKTPGMLIYSNYTQHHNLNACFGAAASYVPRQAKFAHLIDWGEKLNKKTGEMERNPKSLLGFRIAWAFRWVDDSETGPRVECRFDGLIPDGGFEANKPGKEWFGTIVTWKRIQAFFELCDDPHGKTWPGTPAHPSIDGAKEGWKFCDYCKWKSVCKEVETRASPSVALLHAEIMKKRRAGEIV